MGAIQDGSSRAGVHAGRARGRRCARVVACLVSAAAVVLVTGCTTLGPDYSEPEADVGAAWTEAGDPRVDEAPAVEPKWWHVAFGDPDLDRLVEMALEENLTLRSAGLRVLQAQQQLAIAIGNQYPQQQQITGSAARAKEQGVVFDDYSLGFNLSWEPDFWGRFRRAIESASADLDASVANYDAVLISLVSQVAQTYLLIRTFQRRLDVSRENIEAQTESLRITRAKFDAGEVSELDASQAEALLNNTIATQPSLEISLQQFKNTLATLLGKPPQDFDYLLAEDRGIPATPVEIAIGMPQDLVRRRPDIRIAERQLAAQSAQIGVAITDLYPSFAIGGSIGTNADRTGDLFTDASETFSLFGAFQWNVFNYGRLKSNVRLQDARFQQLLVDYRDTVLLAQADVENSIVAYLKSHEQLVSYEAAAAASQRSVETAVTQYQNGLITFNTVISTLQSNLDQQDLLAVAQGDVANNLVQVYRALGGGWEVRENRDPVDLLPAGMKAQMRERTEAWQGVLK
jgi:NodT family efflux transporter outer membrane factor (OMF) lipoprotein